jgi:hypothetical protein
MNEIVSDAVLSAHPENNGVAVLVYFAAVMDAIVDDLVVVINVLCAGAIAAE